MKKKIILIIFFLIFFRFSAAFAQEREIYQLPSWLILEYGRKAFGEQELGVALRYAREAIEKEGGFFPEAEILIGDVFDADGNPDLALRQYQKALDSSRQLYILGDKYQILYKMAAIYGNRDDYGNYEQSLRMILDDDEMYHQAVRTDLGDKMVSMLMEEGLDKLLILYRLQSYHSLQAHSSLGMLYAEQENLEKSALHYLFSVVTVFSRCIEEYKLYDPVYIFENSNDFLALTKRYEAIQNYIAETELYLDMFNLGTIMLSLGAASDLVRNIWQTAAAHSGDSGLVAVIEEEIGRL